MTDNNSENVRFLTSEQLAEAVGISRMTVLRLEDAGLLFHAERSGRGNSRRYSISSLLELFCLQNLHNLGYSYEEASRYIAGEDDLTEIISQLESKANDILHIAEDLRQKLVTRNDSSLFPFKCDSLYYVSYPLDPSDIFGSVSEAISAAVTSGYKLRYTLPLAISVPYMKSGKGSVNISVTEESRDMDGVLFRDVETYLCEQRSCLTKDIPYAAEDIYLEIEKKIRTNEYSNLVLRDECLVVPVLQSYQFNINRDDQLYRFAFVVDNPDEAHFGYDDTRR